MKSLLVDVLMHVLPEPARKEIEEHAKAVHVCMPSNVLLDGFAVHLIATLAWLANCEMRRRAHDIFR